MEELEAYNPLIPDGSNWKATFMIEYSDPVERAVLLGGLIGIEDKTWLQVDGCDKIYAIADEDLERETADKTSSVHFMRYELTPAMVTAAQQGGKIFAGIDHDNYNIPAFEIGADIRDSLVGDLAAPALN